MNQDRSIQKGHSSENIGKLFVNPQRYQKILEIETQNLVKKYPNENLVKTFFLLSKKLLSIGPMALCDYIVQDISGKPANKKVLAAIGLACFTLSTHDDAVDETPTDKSELASLVYAGNICALEAIKKLLETLTKTTLLYAVLETLAENHYRQQWRVDLAWKKKPKDLTQYLKAIEDVRSLVMLAVNCGLVITNNKNKKIKDSLATFATSYAIILQLIDDIREVEEDRISGYNSFPLREGVPFKKSFKAIDHYLSLTKSSIPTTWMNTQIHLGNLDKLIKQLKNSYGYN